MFYGRTIASWVEDISFEYIKFRNSFLIFIEDALNRRKIKIAKNKRELFL